jgi:hypothetical protein
MSNDDNIITHNNDSTREKQIPPKVIAYFRFRALTLGPLRKAAQARIAEEETREPLPGESSDSWYDRVSDWIAGRSNPTK